jgi:hypothetical protein
MIDLDQKQYGPYPSKYEAMIEAQNCARSDRELGNEADVMIQDTGQAGAWK